MTFDKNVCLNNIYFLAKQKGIKIGELETECGASTGYLSRLKQNGNPGIEFLVSAANRLHVSLDALVSHSYDKANPTEEYLHDFIEKITLDSDSGNLPWVYETSEQLETVEVDDHGDSCHPLYESVYTGNEWYAHFTSGFRPKDKTVHPVHGCYHANIGNQNSIYLLKIAVEDQALGGEYEETELYLYKPYGPAKPICHTTYAQKGVLDEDLERLYNSAAEVCKHPQLFEDVKSAIDAYMNPPQPDPDPNPDPMLSFDTNDLPF